ncbi:MAG: BON domain-containing protein [Deltaproteobacteria bacterium]
MGLVAWAMLSWGGSRYWRYGGRYRGYSAYGHYPRDEWDERWIWPQRGSMGGYRNRGPLNYRRSDTRIAEDVNDRLLLDEDIDPSAMEVRVENGRVILGGTVETRFEKRWAERIADSVAGVIDVDNQLNIGRVDHSSRSLTSRPATNTPGISATSH